MSTHTHSSDELQRDAARILADIVPAEGATLLTLSGELGAGKTTFVQGIAEALGVREVVTSPTFVIEKVYTLEGQRWQRLIHIDAYRLHDPHELEMLGWKELLLDAGNLIVLEWPERVELIIPDTAIRIRIDIEGDGRIITIYGGKKKEEN